jgi:hypothetical protein
VRQVAAAHDAVGGQDLAAGDGQGSHPGILYGLEDDSARGAWGSGRCRIPRLAPVLVDVDAFGDEHGAVAGHLQKLGLVRAWAGGR